MLMDQLTTGKMGCHLSILFCSLLSGTTDDVMVYHDACDALASIGSEADVVPFFSFFGGGWGLVDFFAPTEAASSEIVHDGGRVVEKGGGLLGAANLRLGERFVMDVAAALVRDENN